MQMDGMQYKISSLMMKKMQDGTDHFRLPSSVFPACLFTQPVRQASSGT
jgi:hypothetical protein